MMMKRLALAVTLAYLTMAPAFAADNAIVLTPGVGVTERTKDVGGGVQSVIVILGDTGGNPLPTAPGTGNTSFALPIQGVSGGVAIPISGSIGNTGFNALQGSAAQSATNGGFENILQGNAVLSTSNGLPATIVQGGNSATVDSNANLHVVAQGVSAGTAVGGLAGSLVMCDPVTAATSYTAGLANWCTITLGGGLRIDQSSIGGSAVIADPCAQAAKQTIAVSQAGSAQIITGTASKKTYICGGSINISDAESISLTEGTGSVCATNAFAMIGSTTVANGMALSANQGFAMGSGSSTNITPAGDTNATAANLCLLQSGTGRLAGWVTYVQE